MASMRKSCCCRARATSDSASQAATVIGFSQSTALPCANASFTFTAHAVYLPIPRIEIAGPQGVQASFDWQAAKATSPARMCTATLINSIASY